MLSPDVATNILERKQAVAAAAPQHPLVVAAAAPQPPDPLLPNLVLDTPNITFDNGVPVGGDAHLSLFPDGSYSFTGHFHDSGATSYDTSFVYVVKDVFGVSAFTFSHTGRTHGTFEAGSRDDNWNDYGTNPVLAADWGNISSGYNWSSRAGANLNLGGLFDEAVQLVGYAQTVIQVVGNIAG
ncbi:hypothetical protein [uncultured Nostoc sp.]|uniref:hypothetical protein n=1 Tax=uncultured Nostoc sp. TaxID=340711 RepID=UPI0035C98595